jgi:hypothetical protein
LQIALYNYTLETYSQSFAAIGFLATLLWVPEAMSLPVEASTICKVSKIDQMGVISAFGGGQAHLASHVGYRTAHVERLRDNLELGTSASGEISVSSQ